ncbi:hypothetical protein ACFVGY_05945 [Streptomyces sp. NPDC127106]|uniref:hypothetical protein n=1 Tax=Streptomyces sp. NPDC127106 TaxID=3345360 RepID=UPI00363F78FF
MSGAVREAGAREFGTRQMRTRIEPASPGWFRWTRTRLAGRLGPPVPGGFPAPGAAAHVLVGTRSGQTTSYLCRGDLSLAHLVWPPGRSAVPPQAAAAALRAVGHALAGIAHHAPLREDGPTGPPSALLRLNSWLATGDGAGEAVRLYDLCRSLLGRRRLHDLRQWTDELTGPAAGSVLLHGEPSLGLVVLPREGAAAPVLLTGESLARGPAEFDPGWILGELAEMADIARRHDAAGGTVELFGAMAAALLAARGPLDTARLGRVATLRRLAHLVDFASYVRWTPGMEPSLEQLVHLVDEAGNPALDFAPPASAPLPHRG